MIEVIAYTTMLIFFGLLYVIPIAHIVDHAGFSRWWALVALWPGVNLIMLWVFALKRWPAVDPPAPGKIRKN